MDFKGSYLYVNENSGDADVYRPALALNQRISTPSGEKLFRQCFIIHPKTMNVATDLNGPIYSIVTISIHTFKGISNIHNLGGNLNWGCTHIRN
jgi:hypothetical protein